MNKNQENNQKDNLFKMRHSAEHVLTQAMQNLGYKFYMAMGPATDDGFYFDFELLGDNKVSAEDFPKIEKEMKRIIKLNLPITKETISIEEARKLFKNNPYKQEWLDEIEEKGEEATVYYTGKGTDEEFVDLCAGPHVESTGKIGAVKLLSIAGAYWHGDEKNKMLTRIYGTAFENQKELDEYLKMLEEAKKRDHRKLGKDLDLFVFSDIVGKGLPMWTAKGSVIRRELERFIVDEEIKRGYQHVYTPDLAKVALYEKSGHYPYYKDSMYAPIEIDDEKYMLRPMTCPHHFELYLSKPRSYRELPMRIAELAKLYRYEQSGELTGLIRVRGFCLADAHIICADPEQAEQEIEGAIDLIEFVSNTFGLKMGKDYWYRLSLGNRNDDKKYYKDDKAWDIAEDALRRILEKRKAEYVEVEDEAAFYGPKIDIQMKNALGKDDTAFTVQYDFVMPKRFKLTYIDKDGKEKESIVVHRSSIGAIERIVALLIEHFTGAFPVWLAPVQVEIIPISEKFNDYANKVSETLKKENIRVEIDDRDETMGNKIRKAQEMKIPYMIIVGGKEEEANKISVRDRNGNQNNFIELENFTNKLKNLIVERKLELA